jgi:hypothetical protein
MDLYSLVVSRFVIVADDITRCSLFDADYSCWPYHRFVFFERHRSCWTWGWRWRPTCGCLHCWILFPLQLMFSMCSGDIFVSWRGVLHKLSCGKLLLWFCQFSMHTLFYWDIYNFDWVDELLGVSSRTNIIDKLCWMWVLSCWLLLSWSWDTVYILLCWDICKYRRTNVLFVLCIRIYIDTRSDIVHTLCCGNLRLLQYMLALLWWVVHFCGWVDELHWLSNRIWSYGI